MTFDVQTSHGKPFLDQHSAATEEEKTAAPAEALLHEDHSVPQHQAQAAQVQLQVPQVRHVQGRTYSRAPQSSYQGCDKFSIFALCPLLKVCEHLQEL